MSDKKWVDFNLNADIRVRLTDTGRKVYAQWMSQFQPEHRSPLREDSEGWSYWQAWGFMEIFGQHFHMGSNTPCNTDVQIEAREVP